MKTEAIVVNGTMDRVASVHCTTNCLSRRATQDPTAPMTIPTAREAGFSSKP